MIGVLLKPRYTDGTFNKDLFPTLGGEDPNLECWEILWNDRRQQSFEYRSTHTKDVEQEVLGDNLFGNILKTSCWIHSRIIRELPSGTFLQ